MRRRGAILLSCFGIILMAALLSPSAAAKTGEAEPFAKAFGRMPAAWGMRLSPTGEKVSFLQMHERGFPALTVIDPAAATTYTPLGSDPGAADLVWCEWANTERLLCGLRGVTLFKGRRIYETRLVSVDYDGDDMEMLLQDDLWGAFAQFQDRIVDWLADDPEHVLVQVPERSGRGYGVTRLDIYSGDIDPQQRPRDNVYTWLSDGYGEPRLYHRVGRSEEEWRYRPVAGGHWRPLFKAELEDLADFTPVGFGEDRDTLFVIKPHEGRQALFAIDLAGERKERLIFAHPQVDVERPLTLGKHGRLAAIGYHTDRPHFHFFDDRVGRIVKKVGAVFPNKTVVVLDESWDRRYYLVMVSGDRDPGTYYRLDSREWTLAKILATRPGLTSADLAPMQPITYTARDGVDVPGYLTLPLEGPRKNLPTVILPHGGPQVRDTWGFDWLVQFLAAKGYAVLQTNYRGSGGFGEDWAGKGGYRAWRRAMADIADGARALVEDGTADPDRICIVGASYGGYAAMMSAILAPELYRCIVSIAGVSGLDSLMRERTVFVGYRAMREFIGRDGEVRDRASPERRAEEIEVPVLLLHGEDDVNVDVDHSEDMRRKLESAGKAVTLVTYDDADHYFRRGRYRIDMLDRIGRFLARHIGGARAAAAD